MRDDWDSDPRSDAVLEEYGEMLKRLKRIMLLIFLAMLVIYLLPVGIILITGIVMFFLVMAVFVFFHLGVQDFQGY